MAKTTVWFPDGLTERAKKAGLNVSATCRRAVLEKTELIEKTKPADTATG